MKVEIKLKRTFFRRSEDVDVRRSAVLEQNVFGGGVFFSFSQKGVLMKVVMEWDSLKCCCGWKTDVIVKAFGVASMLALKLCSGWKWGGVDECSVVVRSRMVYDKCSVVVGSGVVYDECSVVVGSEVVYDEWQKDIGGFDRVSEGCWMGWNAQLEWNSNVLFLSNKTHVSSAVEECMQSRKC